MGRRRGKNALRRFWRRLRLAKAKIEAVATDMSAAYWKRACKGVRFAPCDGLVPRGYAGASGGLSDVKLVLVLAEPGTPERGTQSHDVSKHPKRVVADVAKSALGAFGDGDDASRFHGNVQRILDECWPGKTFDDQMERTWITESVLCSAEKRKKLQSARQLN